MTESASDRAVRLLGAALDRAEKAIGSRRVFDELYERYGDDAYESPELTDDLERIAKLAHDGHDFGPPHLCAQELCQEIADVRGMG